MNREKESPYNDPEMAAYYAAASAKYQFDRPARDLVSLLEVKPGEMVLDVGSGTGAVARAAAPTIGPSGFLVAIDGSLEMLKRQEKQDRTHLVAGHIPDFPFQSQVFDCAAAGFVISHFPDYMEGLEQILRVLRSGGRFGLTAWSGAKTRVSEIWKDTMRRFVDSETLQHEVSRVIPWDDFFSTRENLFIALQNAGFVEIRQETREYFISLEVDQYVDTKMGSIEGTLLRNHLAGDAWKCFCGELSSSLRDDFPERVEYKRNVHFLWGKKRSRRLLSL